MIPRFYDPESLKRIQQLELRARYIVEGALSGHHKSPFFGQSLEFLQHRQYMPGDDIRNIDWKAWGKTDRFYIKQYEDETNLRASFLIDSSESMLYGEHRGTGMSKYEYACTLAVCLAYLVLAQQDSAGLIRFDEKIEQIVPQKNSLDHLKTIIQALDIDHPREKTDLESILEKSAEAFPRKGITVLFSDLFVPRDGLWKGLKRLRASGHDLIVFHILDDDELEFTFSGPTQFEGLEVPDILRCNPRALRDAYLGAIHTYLDEVKTGCSKLRADYSLVRTSDPFDVVLSRILTNR